MKIDISVCLKNENGAFLVNDEREPITYAKIIGQAMLTTLPDDQNESLEAKMKRWGIYKVVTAPNKDVNLSSEDITLIKQRVAKCFTLLVVGQVVDHLEA